MSEKISEYITSVTALASGDLMDVSKLISTSPLEYQSQKLNYSVLLTELNADLGFIDGSGTTNTVPKFTVSGTIGDSTIIDNGVNYLLSLLSTNGFVKTSGGTGQLSVSSQVSATEGGTGRGSWTAGSLPYISATNTFNELAAGTNGYYLSMVAGVPAWAAVSAPNLGSANLTSTDDARTFTLKSGTTSSQNLQFLNSAGANLFTGRGDNKVVFGSSSIGLSIDKYLNNSVTTDTYINNVLFNRIQTNQRGELWYNTAGAGKVQINAEGTVSLFGSNTEYNIYSTGINKAVILACSGSNTGQLMILNSSGVIKSIIEVGYSVFDSLMKIGGSYAVATAQLQVVGSGATSATTTALFQNSASVAALTIKDDLTSIFGGIVTVPQIITTPATITVTANAGTVTRANRINKFTNSSAATMTITMSTTAALDGDMVQVRIYDFSAAAQTITWVNTENSSVTVPATSNGSTALPLTVGFQYNSATSKWRCIGSV